jgi:hypothetical protein
MAHDCRLVIATSLAVVLKEECEATRRLLPVSLQGARILDFRSFYWQALPPRFQSQGSRHDLFRLHRSLAASNHTTVSGKQPTASCPFGKN